MTLQSHSWAYIQRKTWLKKIHAPPCSLQHCLQQPRHGDNLNIHQQWVKVKITQLCLTLCDLMDYTVHGILQARILECVAFSFSRGYSQPRDQTQVSHIAGGFFTSCERCGTYIQWNITQSFRERGRWEAGSGWGIHVNPWLIHVNVWQKPLQYCKVISLQLIKINDKKNDIRPFAVIWMDLESVILSEVSQRKRNSIWHALYVESKKKWYKWAYKTEGDSQT